jgi:alkyl hydroperoxide reductase subunit AhpC
MARIVLTKYYSLAVGRNQNQLLRALRASNAYALTSLARPT